MIMELPTCADSWAMMGVASILLVGGRGPLLLVTGFVRGERFPSMIVLSWEGHRLGGARIIMTRDWTALLTNVNT